MCCENTGEEMPSSVWETTEAVERRCYLGLVLKSRRELKGRRKGKSIVSRASVVEC